MKKIALVFGLLALSGCMSIGRDLAVLESKKPVAGDFNASLAAEYLGYAQSLAEQGHPIRADRFAARGLAALEGKDVPLAESSEFSAEHETLAAALTPDVKEVAPERAARAQMMFDCMVDGSAICRDSFPQAMEDVQYVADALVHGDDNVYRVAFAEGSTVLDAQGEVMLDVVVRQLSGYGAYRVQLTATGKRGRNATNRLLAVEKGLIKRGVNAGKIDRVRSSRVVELSVDEEAPNQVIVRITSGGARGR